MKVLCAYETRKSKPRVKSELCKQQYTVTLFDCNHLTPVIVLWQMQKFMSLYKFLLCLIFSLRAISKYRPRGLKFERRFHKGVFQRDEFGGLYLEGLIFGILRYLPPRVFHSNNLHACYLLYIYFRYNGEANEKRYSPTLTHFAIPLPGREELVWATALIPAPFRLVTSRS